MPSIVGVGLCTNLFYAFIGIIPVYALGCSVASWFFVKHENELKINLGYEFDYEDLPINFFNFKKIWLGGFIAGLLAGAVGAGSIYIYIQSYNNIKKYFYFIVGTSLITILLFIGVNPRVAAATTGLNNFFMGLTSLFNLISGRAITLYEAWVFTCIALFSGSVVAKIAYYYV